MERDDQNSHLVIFGVAVALGGLRPPPPSLGSWKYKKSKQQSTSMRQRVGEARGLRRVMEVTLYGHDRNFGGAEAQACQKLPLPSPGSKGD